MNSSISVKNWDQTICKFSLEPLMPFNKPAI